MSKMWLDDHNLSFWAYGYCKYVEDKYEIRQFITKSIHIYFYCKEVKLDNELSKNADIGWI